MKRLVLHIDRLVVRGLRIEDTRSFAAGLENELARSLNGIAIGELTQGDARARSSRDPARIPQAAGAGEVGRCVARGIAGALQR